MKNTEFKAYTLHLTDSERDLLVKLIEKSGEFKRGALYSAADELTGDVRHVAADEVKEKLAIMIIAAEDVTSAAQEAVARLDEIVSQLPEKIAAAVSRRTCAVDVSGPSHDELSGQRRMDI